MRSLRLKMILSQVLAIAAAALVFLLVNGFGRYSVEHYYMSPESASARKAAIYARFSSYVSANLISGNDTAAIARWSRQQDYVNIQIIQSEDLNPHDAVNQSLSNKHIAAVSGAGRLYPMRFADGVYQISIEDSSQKRELAVTVIIALMLSSITFISIQLYYTSRLTRRILALSREASEVSAGDLERPIEANGSDELAVMARDMDAMRRSVIDRMGNEKRAWEANSELITAVSHDIRTPMTSLIGYLGLLREQELPEAQRQQFTASAYAKAMELKSLTDELFRYFLVFGRADLDMHMETMDARLLLEQLMGEAEFDLRDSGFAVQRLDLAEECPVSADPMYLKRVMDNLVSNIKKYADPSQHVLLLAERSGAELCVSVSNAAAASVSRVESTKIGLRTCEKIMAHMGGRFLTKVENGRFAAEFILPLITASKI